jgi:hypothetical protein
MMPWWEAVGPDGSSQNLNWENWENLGKYGFFMTHL